MNKKELLNCAIETYGQYAQEEMMIEEMSELTKAILKLRRKTESGKLDLSKEYDNVVEEVADVAIVLDQMKILFGVDAVCAAETVKLKRLGERLKVEYRADMDENEALRQFRECFDGLYGTGLDVANWHMNGDFEPFDTFYESALEFEKPVTGGNDT